ERGWLRLGRPAAWCPWWEGAAYAVSGGEPARGGPSRLARPGAVDGRCRFSRTLFYRRARRHVGLEERRHPLERSRHVGADAGRAAACPPENGDLTLAAGFCATVFADSIGHARHIAVAPSGVVYVNTWSGRYYGNDKPPAGGFIVALRDTTGDGRADLMVRF